jgi:hypothetical protein
MLNNLIDEQNNYFWSWSSDKTIIIGGNDEGIFYGKIELLLNKNNAVIKTDISNGVTSSIGISPMEYNKGSKEFEIISEIYQKFEEFITSQNTSIRQELERKNLMKNVFNLLSKYEEFPNL